MKKDLILIISLILFCFSCGPIEYSAVILGANEAIAEAEENNAMELAPYEYWYAHEHLKKAREEVGYSEFQVASDYARIASEYAIKARDIAIKRKRERGR